MRRVFQLAVACVVVVAIGFFPHQRADASTIFNFNFDDTFDLTLTPPYVGSGTMSVDDTLSDGTYLISSLTNFQITMTIGSDTWTQADMITDPDSAILVTGSASQFAFRGDGFGTLGGSVDFLNGSLLLSFSPNDFPPGLYVVADVEEEVLILSGTYYESVPEPTSLAAWGLLGVAGLIYRARRRMAS